MRGRDRSLPTQIVVSFRHPEMALQASFSTGSIFAMCDDLLQTGDA